MTFISAFLCVIIELFVSIVFITFLSILVFWKQCFYKNVHVTLRVVIMYLPTMYSQNQRYQPLPWLQWTICKKCLTPRTHTEA